MYCGLKCEKKKSTSNQKYKTKSTIHTEKIFFNHTSSWWKFFPRNLQLKKFPQLSRYLAEFPPNIQTFGETSSTYQEKWWNYSNYPGTCTKELSPTIKIDTWWDFLNIQISMQFPSDYLDSWPNFLYELNRLLRHVIVIANNGLINVHLTLVDVVSRRLWVIGTSHFHKLTDECTHYCFYILVIVITLKTKPECKKLVISCTLYTGKYLPPFIFATCALIVNGWIEDWAYSNGSNNLFKNTTLTMLSEQIKNGMNQPFESGEIPCGKINPVYSLCVPTILWV